jgi:outer membrane protein assembly factor BamB
MKKLCVLTVVCALVAPLVQAVDWSQWRGPTQSGVSAEKNLPADWSTEGKNLLWHVPQSGARTAPLIMNGRVYVINRSGEGVMLQERVMCLDLDTGKTIWQHAFNVYLTDIVELRLGWANLAGDPTTGNIYAHGVEGEFFCFDKDGKILWQQSLTEEIGRISGYGGRTNTPVVDGDLVILSSLTSSWGPHGKGLHRFFGFDKLTGEIVWISEPSGAPLDTTYSVPVVATVDGVRTLFAGIADGAVIALKITTGERLWSTTISKRGLNTSPVYADGKLYASHSEENVDDIQMGGVFCFDAKTGAILWKHQGLRVGYSSPILDKGSLYVVDNSANLRCLDAKTGEQTWEFNYGGEGKSSPVLADGKIYVGEVGGAWSIIELTPNGPKRSSEVHFKLPDGSPDEVFASAAVGHGRVVLPTMSQLFCISTQPASTRTPAALIPAEEKVAPGPVARLQIVPAEAWVWAGGSFKFRVRSYDAKGNFISESQADSYTLKGLTLTDAGNGAYTSAADSGNQAGLVTAKKGALTSDARIRVFQNLPYKEDFTTTKDGFPPSGWMSSKLKVVGSQHEGEPVLRKLANKPSPPFARLRCYMTPPIKTGYTVQSDMYGFSKRKRFSPDMGLINARYVFTTTTDVHRKRVLRLVSWAAIPRIQHDVEFPWKPDAWYTAKLSVDLKDGQGIVRAKIWERGTPEPEAWSIEMNDPSPNYAGSPGLYAYSKMITETSPGTEVLFDNVTITENK